MHSITKKLIYNLVAFIICIFIYIILFEVVLELNLTKLDYVVGSIVWWVVAIYGDLKDLAKKMNIK